MQRFFKSFLTISALSSLVIAPFIVSVGAASAQPVQAKKGTDASYVGAGFAAGVTNGGQSGDAATFGGNLAGRLKLGNTPVSARGQINFSDETSAIIPHVSADVGIAKNTNAYVGVGYQFVERDGKPTPSGNKNGVAVVAGVESEVGKNFLVYSNTTVGINAYKNSPASAISINGGVGYRFK
ncbi:histidine kinase [Fischerella sp. PCC 9605]|uniref:histidine kinase n=1 Tax=Fischerella sp. PCC 9605 TaxID=1173024 RepID=UPI00047D93DC|nr:histidine kinase [Fischerella sp. PCC 9605]